MRLHTQRSFSTTSLLGVAILAVVLRCLLLPYPDLLDTTEGRYASVAKFMYERNDWLTPWIFYKDPVQEMYIQQPYNGKPPLHFWLMQLSYTVFGVSSWSARLPSILAALGIGTLVYLLLRRTTTKAAANLGVAVLSSSPLLFFLAGACVVDVTLSCAFTATLVGFAFADRSRGWSWLMSAGLAAGVLVKGPLILVLTGLTVVPWTLLRYWSTGHWPKQISAIRWIDGTAIFLGLVVPWFWLKEQQYPGSLRYFIWNENIARFLFKEYGDIYGKGHVQPFGVVWLMLVLGLFPWSFCAIWSLWQSRTRFKLTALREWCAQNPWGLYGFLWMTSTAVLFTAARQYTGTYLVPSIPGAAILAATLLSPPRSADSSAAPTSEYQSGSYVNVCRLLSIVWVLTLIIGASVLFLRYNAGAFMTLVAVAVGLSLLVRDTRRHLWTDAQRATQQLALTTILLFSCAIGLLAPHISANRSTRDVLAFAQDWGTTRHKAQVRVGFAYNYPFSAGFYGTPPGSETPQATILTVPVSTDQLTSTDVDLLVVRNRNVSQLTGLPANWRRIETQGAWEVFARDGVG